MKKSKLAILSVLILAAVFVFNGKINKVTNPCVQDYVAGQGNIRGNVNVEDYYERDARFAIGAGEDGYAVFKDPGEAFAALREHYPEGISLIRKEFHLLWLSKLNYPPTKLTAGKPRPARRKRASRPNLSAGFLIFTRIALNKMKPLLWDKRFSGILWAVVLGAAFLMLSMLIVNFVSGIPWYLLSSMLRAAFGVIILMLRTRLYGKTTREILSLHNSKIAM